ncbi:cysteine synthase A [Peptoniphilus stercorisuis]|uniref:Cysteine synthase n=1 Tax=Peptoniphilus stercorisuis TaxID=1436965 RepID=A0ABS4KCH1_9FIRM|nr:cysteine synthase A [Peptoniphilus stercorisuis]MBP2025462.1 cysteine synthase A [Peptoniphilus stercorisuis]
MLYKNIVDAIGRTPIVKLNTLDKENSAEIFAKLEYFNPGSSIKDRPAYYIIKNMIEDKKLKENDTIVEATSGNMGIGLAMVASALGYKIIIVMPDTMSVERQKIISAYGAELVLTKGSLGMPGAIEKAEEIASKDGYVMAYQFENKNNVLAHEKTTALEILEDLKDVDAIVAGVGTGGTITGIAKVLKENNKNIKVFAVEPKDSAVLSGEEKGSHKIQGIGAGFIPNILDMNVIDEVIKVSNEDAYNASRELARTEGILMGISGGAALVGAKEVAKKLGSGKKVLYIAPDNGERYLSTDLY